MNFYMHQKKIIILILNRITISIRNHVPHSWLHPEKNILVLLEEVGGDPSRISFGTRYIDTYHP